MPLPTGPQDERSWTLPVVSRLPADPRARLRAAVLRAAVGLAVAAAVVVPVVQFQRATARALRKAEAFDRAHPNWTPAVGQADGPRRPAGDRGAIGRWRKAVRQFWAGYNIYELLPRRQEPPRCPTPPATATSPRRDDPARFGRVYMHPNTPFTVLLLTPFAWLAPPAMALAFNVLKVLVLAAAALMSARLACHGRRRIADWVLLLALAWTILPIVGDIQHGNTNVFALGAVVLHLWLYRRGRDTLAGAPLAVAICLKMTPALFLLYWLYQRNWRLLAGAAGWLGMFGVAIPAAAVGPARYAELTGTWYRHMIRPGLVGGSWYPVHLNQSLSGVVSRYFQDGRNGDIYWGPDDHPHYDEFAERMARKPDAPKDRWITLVPRGERAARWLLRAGQVAVVALMAWAIGWRRLPRDDGRRALHYALVLLGMMLLNQRTWTHHAAVLLPAGVAVWQAVAFGRFSRRRRAWALALVLAAGPCIWLLRGELFAGIARVLGRSDLAAERWANVAKACGPTFLYFALLFAAAVLLAAALRRAADPYAPERQKLRPGR